MIVADSEVEYNNVSNEELRVTNVVLFLDYSIVILVPRNVSYQPAVWQQSLDTPVPVALPEDWIDVSHIRTRTHFPGRPSASCVKAWCPFTVSHPERDWKPDESGAHAVRCHDRIAREKWWRLRKGNRENEERDSASSGWVESKGESHYLRHRPPCLSLLQYWLFSSPQWLRGYIFNNFSPNLLSVNPTESFRNEVPSMIYFHTNKNLYI